MSDSYDVVILGAGPGGYVAGIRAAQLGLKTAVIEKGAPGGVCLNIGCIPSKSLINQARKYMAISELENMGLTVDQSAFNYSVVFEKSRKAADTLSKGVRFLLKKNKVDLIEGEGKIVGKGSVLVNGEREVRGKNLIIATGSRPKSIPGFEFDGRLVLSSTDVLMLDRLPSSMIILGAGAIGVEFAHIMNAFGVEVTIVEMLSSILPLEDSEVTSVLVRSFRRRKIKMLTSTRAVSLSKGDDYVELTVSKDGDKTEVLKADRLVVVVGRTPNTDDIGLDSIGVTTERSFIPVGDYYETPVGDVFAIGDVVNTPLLAHVASKEGEIVVEHIAGLETEKGIDPLHIPSGVYCEPQIASFGYTETQLKEKGIEYQKATFPYRGAGKSVAIEEPEGMVKVLLNPKTKAILGAHIVGAEATELIHELLLAETAELLPEDIAKMIHAHPTLSETVMEAMRAAEGWAIHV